MSIICHHDVYSRRLHCWKFRDMKLEARFTQACALLQRRLLEISTVLCPCRYTSFLDGLVLYIKRRASLMHPLFVYANHANLHLFHKFLQMAASSLHTLMLRYLFTHSLTQVLPLASSLYCRYWPEVSVCSKRSKACREGKTQMECSNPFIN